MANSGSVRGADPTPGHRPIQCSPAGFAAPARQILPRRHASPPRIARWTRRRAKRHHDRMDTLAAGNSATPDGTASDDSGRMVSPMR
jgi:hypothetical protein